MKGNDSTEVKAGAVTIVWAVGLAEQTCF